MMFCLLLYNISVMCRCILNNASLIIYNVQITLSIWLMQGDSVIIIVASLILFNSEEWQKNCKPMDTRQVALQSPHMGTACWLWWQYLGPKMIVGSRDNNHRGPASSRHDAYAMLFIKLHWQAVDPNFPSWFSPYFMFEKCPWSFLFQSKTEHHKKVSWIHHLTHSLIKSINM